MSGNALVLDFPDLPILLALPLSSHHPSGGSQSNVEKPSYILKTVKNHCDRGDSMVRTGSNQVIAIDGMALGTTIHALSDCTRWLKNMRDCLGA
ncbi:hypothetical protein [Pantanalinema sp. GBBB05]|uniref:hypothetical protein n=1 Tax=Pantanalinema sp. GBBB05 TaxID=2604139 RepID=UPI001DB902AB|nr:hypothetical protein [Pantanalinema sp. GBBB05]